ncbi:MAG: GGDEF domain-containing protein, partial [Atribacterota bacterium]
EHDNLTGLYNRTFFEKEAQRADTDQKYPLSIIMGEITGLKSVNEGLGHGEGDVLLIEVADIMERSCRKDDRVARWENDSFIILLPATSREVAQQVCERIQESFRKNVDCLIQVGLVLGSATKNNPQQLLTDLLKTAEGNMYQNKLSGLNFQIHRTRDIF